MSGFQQITIVGRLAKDPEIAGEGDQKRAKLSIPTSRGKGDKEKTTWHNVTAWGRQADFCEAYLSKGRGVVVVGEVQIDEYEGKDGVKKLSYQVRASSVQFGTDSKPQGGEKDSDAPANPSDAPVQGDKIDDGIPF